MTPDWNWLALPSVTVSVTHADTHLPFVLRFTQKQRRWSTLIMYSQCPYSLWNRGENRNFFYFHLCVLVIFFKIPLIFFYETFPEGKTTWCYNNTTYNQQPRSRASTSAVRWPQLSVLQADNRWLGEDLANKKTGDFLFFLFLIRVEAGENNFWTNWDCWGEQRLPNVKLYLFFDCIVLVSFKRICLFV